MTLLGLDVGSSGAKAVVTDEDGTIVASAHRPHAMSMPRPQWFEHDAEAVWWSAVETLLRQLARDADLSQVSAISVSGIGPCLLLVDEQSRPLRPAILYGIDTRAHAEIDDINRSFTRQAIIARGGSDLSSQALGPKLLWVRRHEPDTWARARRFFMASSYIVWRLTGEYVLDHSSASQCDPLYDMKRSRWAEDWVAAIAPGLEFPQLAWSSDFVGRVSVDVATDLGLTIGTPVTAGAIDAWSEAASAGVLEQGDTMVMYGTTLFLVQIAATVHAAPPLWWTQGLFEGQTTFAAGMATAGAITDWFRSSCEGTDFEELFAGASQTPPGSRGLVTLPYFAGERSPVFDPDARGVIAGLTLSHTRNDLFRSALEGIAFGVRHNLEVMREAGVEPSRLVGIGGGARSSIWPQIVTDATGLPQDLPASTPGASYGNAWLAAVALGAASPTAPWTRIAATLTSTAGVAWVYDRLYRVYRNLYETTAADIHDLADFQLRHNAAVGAVS